MKRAAFIAGLCVLAVAGPALAFGTVRMLGQDAEHERITRRALKCTTAGAPECFSPASLDEVAGKNKTWGAVGYPDDPSAGLMSSTDAHCDSGDYLPIPGYPQSQRAAQAKLEGCRAWMVSNMDGAVAEAAGLLDSKGAVIGGQVKLDCDFGKDVAGAKCKTLQKLGAVLHASQDFYSHSNWADLPKSGGTGTENPPGLGNSSPAPWISLRASVAFPAGLISGCYEGFPERFYCKGRVKHAVLNKDTGTIDPSIGAGTTPRGESNGNFKRAVEAAVADSRDKWALLRERLEGRYGPQKSAKMICALTRDDPVKQCV